MAVVNPLTMRIFCRDQTLSKEWSSVWIAKGMYWDDSPMPRMRPMVESIKMIVVIPNKNTCP
jgi:hypothetical protein